MMREHYRGRVRMTDIHEMFKAMRDEYPPRKAKPNAGRGDPMKTVWVYVDTKLPPGDVDHLQVFANEDAARRWIEEHDPEAAAFEYPVRE
jgi:hypothetical protein